MMKKRILYIAIALVAQMLMGCELEKTRYEIQYCFDNTEMGSDFFEAHELINPNSGTGVWRSNRHHLDTVYTETDTIEWASGKIKDVASHDCTALKIYTSGYRPQGGGNYVLDTIFYLEKGERNFFYVTPSMKWHNQY